ncbi:MAG TPA: HAMP domain-containing sensor histidine kinase [Solirubrobacteraceae bacterium]|jgi:signal transduction histidine kinase|nr:HAMP domain-containing sensor histidine kinase [Solirubrobacteraceae bacterium]
MSSAPDGRLTRHLARLPIRLRLATSVAAVAFVILVAFAVIIGQVSSHRIRSNFNAEVLANARSLANIQLTLSGIDSGNPTISPPLSELGTPADAVVRILTIDGTPVAGSRLNLGNPVNELQVLDFNGYRIINTRINFGFGRGGWEQYAQPLSSVRSEIGWLELMLLLGALVGTVLAFGAGSLVARRSIAPVAELTAAAADIERTRDPNTILPTPIADDEIAELSRTLSGMLTSLSDARNETEAMLERQREFVADASHELRTPLTSVLANLELLVDSLRGADRDAAESALRSTQRMRRLVGDLLLLARADAAAQTPLREPLDLADVVVEAASELGPAASAHTIELDIRPTPLLGARDDLQRVATNLIENALRHTPPGTRVTASTRVLADGGAELVVADDGPGIDPEARATLFERFVRGAGDRGGSFGLGLAIVAAVAQAHGGTVAVDTSPHGGARFTVRLPAAEPVDAPAIEPLAAEPA